MASLQNSRPWGSLEERGLPSAVVDSLSGHSTECLKRLANYDPPPLPDFGIMKQAAVLVALFEKDGELHVLLTTRAKTLRRHPSQTALPGGKVDPEDEDVIFTARREAHEEVDLPLNHPSIHHLTILDPFLTSQVATRLTSMIAVVCFLSDPSLLIHLRPSPDEVDAIFTHPLKGCLTGEVEGKNWERLTEKDGEWWPYEEEFHVSCLITVTGGYRMHRFRSERTPIKGLTSDVLIHTATVAYGSSPSFARFAPDQPSFSSAISDVVLELPRVINSSSSTSPGGTPRVLEWGGAEVGQRIISGETWALD
ncbi:hypothetical protein I350_03479 [Cryptococcus amylolentus CBS 6273]|uniref:Nudix hydrolase domain-containing protein n=1 Tax=Cryptococcus amylolentus CBS 6273 TaxID=1296118 RepID=A0A1E3K3T9_9TREE|nr:hypothetical protein I350_03479 [Cryptococcus amylolentus CBS 6273]